MIDWLCPQQKGDIWFKNTKVLIDADNIVQIVIGLENTKV